MAVLTLSREHQNGCVEIGQEVARRLGYDFVNRYSIYANLSKAGERWGKLAQELDEERPTLWERYDKEYRGFIALLESTIYDYAQGERAVILGRGSAFILHDIPQVLKVRLFAPLNVRVERVMLADNVDRRTAELTIEQTDKSRSGYIHTLYRRQLQDMENYDLLFNTSIQTYEQVTQNLVEILSAWDQRGTPESRKKLTDRALAAKLKAQIFTHPEVFIPTLEVFHDGRQIVLKGVIHTPREKAIVEEMVHAIAGSHPVRNELHYRT